MTDVEAMIARALDEHAGLILRRIETVLSEARLETKADQSMKFIMRVVSNYCSVGADVSSRKARLDCRRMSLAARELRHSSCEHHWLKRVTNEHQDSLDRVWRWMVEQKGELSPAEVLSRFKQWPMVTITRDEATRLQPDLEPAERYREAKIETVDRIGAWPDWGECADCRTNG